MWRLIGGTILGVIVWTMVVTVLDIAMRDSWPAYAAVLKAMTFTLPMMIARLSESALSSLASGAAAGWIGRRAHAGLAAGLVLLLMFLPVHYQLWHYFPVWYHLIFLVSLPLLGWIGGRLTARRYSAG